MHIYEVGSALDFSASGPGFDSQWGLKNFGADPALWRQLGSCCE